MEHAAALNPRTPRVWGDRVLVTVIGVAGVLMAHSPMILSGFRKLQVDLGDSRLIHYLLEHGYLWIRGTPGHREFWNPPFFYPTPNTAAYTDIFLTVGPPYWMYRAAGIPVDLSFGLWMVTMSVLNYAAGVALFRKGLRLDVLPSAAGSFLIAFGTPRINQIAHQQLLPCFYVLMTVYALARLFGDPAPGRAARWIYWPMAALGCVLQFYAGVYLAWFLTLGAGITAVIAVALPSCRGAFLKVLKRDMWCIFAATAVGMLLLLPLVTHYQPVNREVTIHRYMPTYRHLHPDFGSWLDVGPGNWVGGWTAGWRLFHLFGDRQEHHLGIGLTTTIACLCGLYLGRQWPICRLAAAVWLALCLATTFMPSDTLTLAATGLAFLCMTGLYRDVGKPGERASGLAIVLGILLLVRFPGEHMQALGIGVIVLCLLEIFRAEAEPESRFTAAVALALACSKLFAIEVMPTATAISAAVSVPLAILFKRRWRTIGLVAIISWLAFLVMITYLNQLQIPLAGLAAVGACLAAESRVQASSPRPAHGASPALRAADHRHLLWLGFTMAPCVCLDSGRRRDPGHRPRRADRADPRGAWPGDPAPAARVERATHGERAHPPRLHHRTGDHDPLL